MTVPVSILATCLWVLAVSVVGMMPRRFHKPAGFPLMFLFFPLLVWVGYEMGWIWAVVLLFAGLSIFRYPAKYYGLLLWRRITGRGAPNT